MDDATTVSQPQPLYQVHCDSSSDFVVGRQTNFNAPVTIIAANGSGVEKGVDERVVLNGGLLARDAAGAVATANGCITNPSFVYLNGGKGRTDEKERTLKEKQSWCGIKVETLGRVWLGLPLFLWVIIGVVVACSLVAALVQILTDAEFLISPGHRDALGNSSHRFITKQGWRGRNATSAIPIHHPIPYVVISHTVSAFCYETDTCSSIVRNIQRDTMSRTPPFADVPYNFLVGGDGNIYEGRGWKYRSPHEGYVNNRNIDITFIGDFSVQDIPTGPQVDAVQELLRHGVLHEFLAADYLLFPHNATQQTLSPGKRVYEIICQWPNFSAKLPVQPRWASPP